MCLQRLGFMSRARGFCCQWLDLASFQVFGTSFCKFWSQVSLEISFQDWRTLFESVFGICFETCWIFCLEGEWLLPVIQYVQRCIQTVSGSTGVYVKNYPSDLGTRFVLSCQCFWALAFWVLWLYVHFMSLLQNESCQILAQNLYKTVAPVQLKEWSLPNKSMKYKKSIQRKTCCGTRVPNKWMGQLKPKET